MIGKALEEDKSEEIIDDQNNSPSNELQVSDIFLNMEMKQPSYINNDKQNDDDDEDKKDGNNNEEDGDFERDDN